MMTVTIEVADNGYVVSTTASGERTNYVVIEEADEPLGAVRAAQSLLWEVLEQVGMFGSKHDAARVRVVLQTPDGEDVK